MEVPLKPEELAAYIGAAAWVPQIFTWVYNALLKSKLRIVPDQTAEIGFTSVGPIFNVRMAFFVEGRDLIIDGINLLVRHEGGEVREFRWAGLGEKFSEITDAAGNKQIISKDQTPIAIKVVTQSLLDKFVRFQEPRYHAADNIAARALVSQFNFLKQKFPDGCVGEVQSTREYCSLVQHRQDWFWWKPGRYNVTITPSSPQKFEIIDARFAFTLQEAEIDILKRNLPIVEIDIKNTINSNLPNPDYQPVNWQWANVSLISNKGT
jgi:hypothetical protein